MTAADDRTVGCRVNPQGEPLTLGDMRRLIARADQLKLPDWIVPSFRTPIAGDRRAVTITLLQHPPHDPETVTGPPPEDDFDPGRYGAASSRVVDPETLTTTTR